METTYLVVKDETGIFRPMAGIWTKNEHGVASAKKFLDKDPECTVVEIKIVEIKNE